jgi:hypothetical protein
MEEIIAASVVTPPKNKGPSIVVDSSKLVLKLKQFFPNMDVTAEDVATKSSVSLTCQCFSVNAYEYVSCTYVYRMH